MSQREQTIIVREKKIVAAPETACLVQIYGSELGKRFPFTGELTAGRDESNTIVLLAPSASRHHARFYRHEEAYYVTDLGSTNGIYVNDTLIAEDAPLRNGDLIKLGGAILKFIAGGNVEALYHEEIHRMAIIDGLTGIHNRRYFFDFLDREMARCVRYGNVLSLALLDVDHFKILNDTFGHVAGDHVLEGIAQIAKQRTRREALLARYGGEEFALVLPEIELPRAELFCEKVRKLIEDEIFLFGGKEIRTTVSIGIAAMGERRRRGDFIEAADEQLYRAKKMGRNRVVTELADNEPTA